MSVMHVSTVPVKVAKGLQVTDESCLSLDHIRSVLSILALVGSYPLVELVCGCVFYSFGPVWVMFKTLTGIQGRIV